MSKAAPNVLRNVIDAVVQNILNVDYQKYMDETNSTYLDIESSYFGESTFNQELYSNPKSAVENRHAVSVGVIDKLNKIGYFDDKTIVRFYTDGRLENRVVSDKYPVYVSKADVNVPTDDLILFVVAEKDESGKLTPHVNHTFPIRYRENNVDIHVGNYYIASASLSSISYYINQVKDKDNLVILPISVSALFSQFGTNKGHILYQHQTSSTYYISADIMDISKGYALKTDIPDEDSEHAVKQLDEEHLAEIYTVSRLVSNKTTNNTKPAINQFIKIKDNQGKDVSFNDWLRKGKPNDKLDLLNKALEEVEEYGIKQINHVYTYKGNLYCFKQYISLFSNPDDMDAACALQYVLQYNSVMTEDNDDYDNMIDIVITEMTTVICNENYHVSYLPYMYIYQSKDYVNDLTLNAYRFLIDCIENRELQLPISYIGGIPYYVFVRQTRSQDAQGMFVPDELKDTVYDISKFITYKPDELKLEPITTDEDFNALLTSVEVGSYEMGFDILIKDQGEVKEYRILLTKSADNLYNDKLRKALAKGLQLVSLGIATDSRNFILNKLNAKITNSVNTKPEGKVYWSSVLGAILVSKG